jgi:hypothetical protein
MSAEISIGPSLLEVIDSLDHHYDSAFSLLDPPDDNPDGSVPEAN